MRKVAHSLLAATLICACQSTRSGLAPPSAAGHEPIACTDHDPALCTPATKPKPLLGRAEIEHFSIEVPPGFELDDMSPEMADFEIYDLVDRAKQKLLCRLYFGNYPRFPMYSWSGTAKFSTAPRREQKEFRSADRIEGTITFSGLRFKGFPVTPWSIIHYFADDLSESDLQLIERMIQSIEVTRISID